MSKLEKYQKMRDFSASPEPTGKADDSGYPLPIFVIQRHDSRHLHFDLRLEYRGVLLSWAITKKPVMNKEVKRLAVHVEDHPLDYANFDGLIPKGNYGAGIVQIWDRGFYYLEDTTSKSEIEDILTDKLPKGHFVFYLKGQKLDGKFVLVKLSHSREDWLLYYDNVDKMQPDEADDKSDLIFFSPMLPTLIEKPFNSPEWLFEPKLDGYRIIAYIENNNVKLISRNQNDYTSAFPQIVNYLKTLNIEAVIDGELVALDDEGRPSFSLLHDNAGGNAIFYIFDILHYKHSDLRNFSLIKRKEILNDAMTDSSLVKVLSYKLENGIELFEKAQKLHLEGVVAKKLSSYYESGRTREWLKFKAKNSLDLIVVGYIPNDRGTLKSLMLAEQDKLGNFIYRGNVGTGFTEELRIDLMKRMKPISRSRHIFDIKPSVNVQYVIPDLIVEVDYLELTDAGHLRHPVFKKIRDDKS